jgi:hypothetical protein
MILFINLQRRRKHNPKKTKKPNKTTQRLNKQTKINAVSKEICTHTQTNINKNKTHVENKQSNI